MTDTIQRFALLSHDGTELHVFDDVAEAEHAKAINSMRGWSVERRTYRRVDDAAAIAAAEGELWRAVFAAAVVDKFPAIEVQSAIDRATIAVIMLREYLEANPSDGIGNARAMARQAMGYE